jgi:KDO2-lipid IV(A) lauroyltransferase
VKKLLKTLRYGAEAFSFFALMGIFRVLGLNAASALGGFIGREIFYRSTLTWRARANLHLAYPRKSAAQIEAVTREMWDNLGRTVAEYAHLDRLSIEGPDPRIEIAGLEFIEAARASGRGIIFISGHFANWEVMPFVAHQLGIDGGEVYRPINNRFVDRWMVRRRIATGPKEQIAKGAQGTRRIFALLRAKKAIFLLADQKTNEGVAVPFFGRIAMTTSAPAALALKLGAVLLPASNERLAGSRFRMTIHPPIAFERTGHHDPDVLALTSKINNTLEEIVRRRPSQWLWIHRRWPKPGERPRSRRTIRAQALAGDGVRVEREGSGAT